MVDVTRQNIIDAVNKIISLEENDRADRFPKIEKISIDIIRSINACGFLVSKDDWILYQFLDDYDIRLKDKKYAAYQTEAVLKRISESS